MNTVEIHRSADQPILVNKEIVEDTRLSLSAKGLLVEMLMLADRDNKFNASLLLDLSRDTETAIKEAAKELFDVGYINYE